MHPMTADAAKGAKREADAATAAEKESNYEAMRAALDDCLERSGKRDGRPTRWAKSLMRSTANRDQPTERMGRSARRTPGRIHPAR